LEWKALDTHFLTLIIGIIDLSIITFIEVAVLKYVLALNCDNQKLERKVRYEHMDSIVIGGMIEL
jgi:hypothetical protein